LIFMDDDAQMGGLEATRLIRERQNSHRNSQTIDPPDHRCHDGYAMAGDREKASRSRHDDYARRH
jgi:CheY-like chemotaxis protein